MVGHQAIAPQLRRRLGRRLGHEVAVERIVAVLEENRRAPVATLRHVIGNAGQNEPGKTGHGDASTDYVHLVRWHRNASSASIVICSVILPPSPALAIGQAGTAPVYGKRRQTASPQRKGGRAAASTAWPSALNHAPREVGLQFDALSP